MDSNASNIDTFVVNSSLQLGIEDDVEHFGKRVSAKLGDRGILATEGNGASVIERLGRGKLYLPVNKDMSFRSNLSFGSTFARISSALDPLLIPP